MSEDTGLLASAYVCKKEGYMRLEFSEKGTPHRTKYVSFAPGSSRSVISKRIKMEILREARERSLEVSTPIKVLYLS